MDVEGAICKKPKAAYLLRLQLRRLKASAVDVPSKKTPSWDENSTSSSTSSSSDSSSPESSSPDSGETEEPVEEEEKRSVCVSHGCVSLIGRRREMEDAVAVKTGFFNGGEYDFYGVYDGHGGAWVAEACRERMHVVIEEEAAPVAEEDEGRWRRAMAAGFARMDGEVAAEKTVGSTAVVAIVGRRRILVANCGDSRAVLSRGGFAVPLSEDHKPERPDEMKRIEEAGGRIINWDGYRILGVLATSRSIGDCYLKPYVTAEPEITVTQRSDKDEFLILASDGLWDVVSNEVACRVTRQCLSGQTAKMFPDDVHGHSAAEAAILLAELAMSRGSKDNISIIVVELARLDSRCSSRRCKEPKP